MAQTDKTEKVSGPRITIYEGARRFKPGSPESKWPERFKSKDFTKLSGKDHTGLREKMFKGKPDPPPSTSAEAVDTGATGSQPTVRAGSNASADKDSG